MAKPPCNFVIVQTGPNAQGEYTFSTNPPFPNCEVHIAVNGEAAGSHMGDDVGDVHIEQLGHDSVTVRRLKDNFHVVVEITVECANCGPTTVRRESGPGPARRKLPLAVAILLAPFSFIIWLILQIWDWIQELWKKIKALF